MVSDIIGESLNYLPYIKTYNNKVLKVSYAFINLTGFELSELMGMEINKVCTMLRLHCEYGLNKVKKNKTYYLFTKNHQPREVTIIQYCGLIPEEEIYVFLETPNSRLEDTLPYVHQYCFNELFGFAVMSIPERIILMANQYFYDLVSEYQIEYKYFLGMKIDELIKECIFSFDLWSVLKKIRYGTTVQLKEVFIEQPSKGIMYYDILIIPIVFANKVKYCLFHVYDVTDKVLLKQASRNVYYYI